MNIAQKLQHELENIFGGHPWYGSPIYTIINAADFEGAYEKPPGSVHNVAGIILHMLAWTEETIERLNGRAAGTPTRGDWPEPGTPDEQKWPQLVNYLKLANTDLLKTIGNFPEDKWQTPINDKRGNEPVTTYQELVYGFIQHQIYHAGQIALLNRINYGSK